MPAETGKVKRKHATEYTEAMHLYIFWRLCCFGSQAGLELSGVGVEPPVHVYRRSCLSENRL